MIGYLDESFVNRDVFGERVAGYLACHSDTRDVCPSTVHARAPLVWRQSETLSSSSFESLYDVALGLARRLLGHRRAESVTDFHAELGEEAR